MQTKVYEIQTNENGRVYTFVSEGKRNITKIVRYDEMFNLYHVKAERMIVVYNLGFGDKRNSYFEIDDKVRSNNGDMYTVFNTVLHTIPKFFSAVGLAAIHIRGSDKLRHLAYHRFINRNIKLFNSVYDFYGFKDSDVVPFAKNDLYEYIVVLPKIL